MRAAQFIGLNDRTKKWLRKRAAYKTQVTFSVEMDPDEYKHNPVKTIEDVLGRNLKYKVSSRKVMDTFDGKYIFDPGIFGEPFPLSAWRLKDGRVVYEKIQTEIWSSGPVVFTFLVWEDGTPLNKSRWKKQEMDTYL